MRKSTIRLCLVLLTLFTLFNSSAFAQVVAGKIVNSATNNPIPFVNVTIVQEEGSKKQIGVASDENGIFLIGISQPLPIELEFTAVGFLTRRIKIEEYTRDLEVRLSEDYMQLGDVYITSDKTSEQDLKAPIETIKVGLVQLQSTPSFNFYESLGNLKGVDLTTQSVVINTVNTRGFNSSTNQRFRQFTDGIDNQAPGLSFSLGNIVGPSTLDIESVQLVPGPSSAFYGPSSFNGVLEMTTKNPFDYQGFSFTAKAATVSVEKDKSKFLNFGDNFISDFSARYAVAFKDKIGIKLNASILEGVDFRANNYDNIGPGEVYEDTHSIENQSINLVNVYGDDRAALLIVPRAIVPAGGEGGGFSSSVLDTALYVTRQGYREEDLVNYNARNLKLNGEIQFKLNEDIVFSVAAFYGQADAMITSDDRIALRDFDIFQQKAEVKGKNFLLRAYQTQQDAGNTYNVGLLGERIVQAAKPDEVWFDQYRRLYLAGRGFVGARSFANSQFPGNYIRRFEPGTEQYDSVRTAVINREVSDNGARIFDKSELKHVEGMYNLTEMQDFFSKLTAGGSYRLYDPESNGTLFTDTLGNDVTNYEYGAFIDFAKELSDKTEASASLRFDKNENFEGKFSQRLSVVHQLKDIHYIRASFQRGFRFPNVREQFYNQDLGDKIIIGGLSEVTDYYQLQGNAFLQNALNDYNDAVAQTVYDEDAKLQGAKLQHLNILADGIVSQERFRGLEPEQITSFELGYRSLVQDRRIFEVTYYRNYYNNFIGNLRVVKPRTSPSSDLARAAEQANSPGSSDIFFVTANADEQIITQGLELLYDISGSSGVNFAVNATFADIIQNSSDPLVPGFNTPPFKFNVKVGHRRISRNFGAEFTWRSRTEFEWQSAFVDGTVAGFSTFDLQMSLRMPSINSFIRVGGTNLHNIGQYNSFGGPEINAFYYISFTYDPFQSR
ncbi:TonB-dependent receptor [Roseivirga sp.]|uniref:TonB-dependent receptor n=1 Tax=Roseivirga sp. TaxID=1964215 RepID=UPI003B5193BE